MYPLWQIKRVLWAALGSAPRSVRQVAQIVWGLWLLAGEMLKLIDVVCTYPARTR